MRILLYCKSQRRQPVYRGIRFPYGDSQGQLPDGWCVHCGKEIFSQTAHFCPECRVKKGDKL